MDLVSIIIPVYNQAHFLLDSIPSALEQTYKDIEVVVCDDGSTDNTSEMAGKLGARVVKHEINKGLPFARNTAIKAAQGKYIIPLDADDKLMSTAVEKIVSAFHQDGMKSLGIVNFHCLRFWEGGPPEGQLWKLAQPTLRNNIVMNTCFVSSSFPKSVWEEVGGYDEEMNDGFEDWEFWMRIMEAGYTVTTIDEPLFWYRIRKNSKGQTRTMDRMLASRKKMFYKHRISYYRILKSELEEIQNG